MRYNVNRHAFITACLFILSIQDDKTINKYNTKPFANG